jgi:signal transduction histidine kinase
VWVSGLLVGAGILLALGPFLPWSVAPLRVMMSAATPLCLLALVFALVVRVAVATGEGRASLRSAAYGLVTTPGLLAVGFILNMLFGKAFFQLFLPLLAPAIPLAIAYAIARHDLLQSEAVLTRRLASLPVVFFATSLGLFAWLAIRYGGGGHAMSWLYPVITGLLVTGLVAVFGHRFIGRLFFRAAEAYRPTIDQLSERISVLNDEPSILAELARLLEAWLPLDSARVIPAAEIGHSSELTPRERGMLHLGQRVQTTNVLWVPMRFQGSLTGAFRLGRKVGGALFTSMDLSLLETMAALGGVALHHAAALREIESLRTSQLRAAKDERAGVVDTLSAEIAHELGHSLRYFRAMFEDRGASAPFDPEEISVAQGEVERMDRMRRTLETLEVAPPKKEALFLTAPVEHARFLLHQEASHAGVDIHIQVEEGLLLLAERGPLVQVFVNLFRNAIQAAGPGGHIGLRASRIDSGARIEVWDSGPGIAPDVKGTLFRVWGITTRAGGRGLGLMVCSRIVQQLHWSIDFGRQGDRTVFRILVPAADVVGP